MRNPASLPDATTKGLATEASLTLAAADLVALGTAMARAEANPTLAHAAAVRLREIADALGAIPAEPFRSIAALDEAVTAREAELPQSRLLTTLQALGKNVELGGPRCTDNLLEAVADPLRGAERNDLPKAARYGRNGRNGPEVIR